MLFSDKFPVMFSLFIDDLWTFLLSCRDRYPLCHLLRPGAFLAGYAGYDAPRLCSSWLSQAKIFGILVGLDQKDSSAQAGYSGRDAPRAVLFSLVRRPMMLGIMTGMDLKDSCSGMYKAGSAGETGNSAVAVPAGRRLPFRAAKTALHGPALSEDHRDFAVAVHGDRCPCCAGRAGSLFRRGSVLLYTVAEVPVVQVEQVHFPVVTQRLISMVQPFWRTIENSQLK